MYKINKIDDFKYLTFTSLEKHTDLFHCFTTRHGGVSKGPYSSLNLGIKTDDNIESIHKNYEVLSNKLNIPLDDIVRTHQTHTNIIRYVNEMDKGKVLTDDPNELSEDGLITDIKGIALMTFHADCTPICFYDPVKKVIGMAHAGWRGTINNIAGIMVKKFVKDFKSDPQTIQCVIGPSLGLCCFEVDEDVAQLFLKSNSEYEVFMKRKGIKYHFDLWEINKYIMLKEGMKENNIEISGICTKCNNDILFSHRGQKGVQGLMAGIIMMT